MEEISRLPEDMARKYNAILVGFSDGRPVIETPWIKASLLQDVRLLLKKEPIIRMADEDIVSQAIEEAYKEKSGALDSVELMERIIETSFRQDASDIHIEPYKSCMKVRIRKNGDLIEIIRDDRSVFDSLCSVIKIRSGLDITERRLPQDGRIEYESKDVAVDLRISTIPVIYGEKIVIRLLNRKASMLNRERLGFSNRANRLIDSMLFRKSGLVVVSGPTGSGKTTTLYSFINELMNDGKNITTIEDPVEYRLEGINQIQINSKTGMSYETGLRAILRQDPDIIVIGEIRDRETASIAVSAANSGHLVLTSIHTQDAVSTVSRLIEMGVEPYMMSASLAGIVSQRLIKADALGDIRESLRVGLDKGAKRDMDLIIGKAERKIEGNRGAVGSLSYNGEYGKESYGSSTRRMIYEVLIPSHELRRMITRTKEYEELRIASSGEGFIDFRGCIEES